MKKELGWDHLHTLVARDTYEFMWTLLGGAQRAARRLPRIVAAMEAQVGPDSPYTLVATAHLAVALGWVGEIKDSRGIFRELLPRLQAVLGPEHPQTLLARSNYAAMLLLHDREQALEIYEEVLPALERTLGNDHPLCITHRWQQALLTLMERKPLEAAYRFGNVGVASARRAVRQPRRTLRRVRLLVDGAGRMFPVSWPPVIRR
jgi:hypothetical protein